MKKTRSRKLIFILILMFIAGCATQTPTAPLPEPQVDLSEPTAEPVDIQPSVQIPEGWKGYTDEAYGFSFSYPEPYTVLTDEENLYGWENCILLVYDGGQSYDIAVQVWDSMDELKANIGGRMDDVTVFEHKGQFISVFSITMEENNQAIIATFQLIN